MLEKLLCVDCSSNIDCPTYKIIENTLDNNKVHYKLGMKLEFIFTANEPQEFKTDFEQYVVDIAEQAAALSEFIQEQIKDCACDVQQLGAKMDLKTIPNKQAFDELVEYIKVTHETSNE